MAINGYPNQFMDWIVAWIGLNSICWSSCEVVLSIDSLIFESSATMLNLFWLLSEELLLIICCSTSVMALEMDWKVYGGNTIPMSLSGDNALIWKNVLSLFTGRLGRCVCNFSLQLPTDDDQVLVRALRIICVLRRAHSLIDSESEGTLPNSKTIAPSKAHNICETSFWLLSRTF